MYVLHGLKLYTSYYVVNFVQTFDLNCIPVAGTCKPMVHYQLGKHHFNGSYAEGITIFITLREALKGQYTTDREQGPTYSKMHAK
jgi:hypothetical protein